MGAPTIPCPECGKSHRAAGWEEAVARCKATREKREEREAAKAAREAEQEANWQREKPWELVWRLRRAGIAWSNIMKPLREAYGGAWTIYDVVKMDSVRLLKTWPADLETITLLRLEKIHTGEYMSCHPLELDGTFSLSGQGGRQLEIPWGDEELKAAEKRRRAEAKAAA